MVEILVVDDDAVMRTAIAEICRTAGYSVAEAEDGDSALAAIARGDHFLILLDIHMPGLDGIAVAQAIRAMPAPVSEVPIIAVTGDYFPHTRARCSAAGVNDLVAKPIVPAELLTRIALHLDLVSSA